MSSLVTKVKIKEIIGNIKISENFYEKLDKKVEKIILDAVFRAKKNGRRTVMARDI